MKAADIPRIMRSSVVSLNFPAGGVAWEGLVPRRTAQIKARTFEVPGAGGFLLTGWAEGLEDYYLLEREISVYRTQDELADRIRHYCSHFEERDEIAWAGHRRTAQKHTYDRRMQDVIQYALARKAADQANSGRRGIDWARFAQASERHTADGGLRLLRNALVSTCSRFWGQRRGPRAARRLMFEASWRLAGRRTYSAAGLPGRLFYEVS